MDVGIVTVGDELLSGDTPNSNATWLGQQLTARGVEVRRLTVVPDEISEIVTVVDAGRNRYDALIVTGGLGPTHDDVTMEAIANVFEQPVTEHPSVLDWLQAHRGYAADDLAAGTAALPANATPLHNEEGVAPGAVIENVYVLPGVPEEMKAMFESIADDFAGVERHRRTIRVDEPESALVDRLGTLRDRFDVRVGSYPGSVVVIRLTSEDPTEVDAAAEWFRERVTVASSTTNESSR